MRKKILVIVPSLKYLSPVKVAIEISNGLAELGSDVEIFPIKNESFDEFKLHEDVTIVSRPSTFYKYDVVHSHCFQSNIISAFLYLFSRGKVKFITTVHTDIDIDLKDKYPKLNAFLVRLWKWSIGKNDVIICLNKEVASKFKKKNTVKLIPNGSANPDILKETSSLIISDKLNHFLKEEGKIILGMACVIREVKGLDRVARLLAYNNNIKLLLLGDGPYLSQFKRLLTKLGVYDRVFFYGFTKEPLELLKNTDVAVFPSYSEGFPLSLIEAMSIGLPCVTSNISSFTTFFTDEVIIADVDDLELFNIAVESAKSDRDYYSRMSLDTYEKSFTAKVMSKNYNEVMNEILR
ncbi:glycosyltransferase family 4 protein [Enterovibrio sp. Hal110]